MKTRRLLVLTLCGLSLGACATGRAARQAALPNQAAAIAAAVATVVPEQAAAVVEAAIRAAPDQAVEIRRAVAEVLASAEGLALPAPVVPPEERSDFARHFMAGDRMVFPDLVR